MDGLDPSPGAIAVSAVTKDPAGSHHERPAFPAGRPAPPR